MENDWIINLVIFSSWFCNWLNHKLILLEIGYEGEKNLCNCNLFLSAYAISVLNEFNTQFTA